MRIAGSNTVEYIEHEGQVYERTQSGSWSVRIGESTEPVFDDTELETEYAKALSSTRRIRSFDFADAIRLIEDGWNAWAAKDHNKKWARRVEGTPIRNDLTCSIAHTLIAAIRQEKGSGNDSIQ